jgi:diguanylate cyclase (GGDEF)-like protein
VVACLQQAVPAQGLLGRVGGEEFTLLLPHDDPEAAEAVAQRARRAIEAHAFGLPDGSRVTASFGISCLPAGASFDEAYGQADEALYAAKRGGRNCVAHAGGDLQLHN